jgi:hypothetical protein
VQDTLVDINFSRRRMQSRTGQKMARSVRVRRGKGGTGQERVEQNRAGNGRGEVDRK